MTTEIVLPLSGGAKHAVKATPVAGLFVHRAVESAGAGFRSPREWCVSHHSGFFLVRSLKTKKDALAAAERFAPLADWSLPVATLRACPSLRADLNRVKREIP